MEGEADDIRVWPMNDHAALPYKPAQGVFRLIIAQGVIAFVRRNHQHVRVQSCQQFRHFYDFRIITKVPAGAVKAQQICPFLLGSFHGQRLQQHA